MTDGLQIILGIGAAAVAVVGIRWHYARSRAVLDQWARERGYSIVYSEHRHFSRGPFFWTTSKGQTVYYVRIRDRQGESRSGWVRCGGWFSGLISDKAEVKWEDGR